MFQIKWEKYNYETWDRGIHRGGNPLMITSNSEKGDVYVLCIFMHLRFLTNLFHIVFGTTSFDRLYLTMEICTVVQFFCTHSL